jgi:hypothetical protein
MEFIMVLETRTEDIIHRFVVHLPEDTLLDLFDEYVRQSMVAEAYNMLSREAIQWNILQAYVVMA